MMPDDPSGGGGGGGALAGWDRLVAPTWYYPNPPAEPLLIK